MTKLFPFFLLSTLHAADSTTPGEVRFAGGILQINTDTDRAAEMEIALERVTAFSRPMLII